VLIDVSIVIIFLIANLIIGLLASKNINNFSHFSVGHRSFNSFIIFATLTASFIGGGYSLGNAAKVYSDGMMYAFALLGFSLKEILVAQFIAPRMDAHNDCFSIGDIIFKRYGLNAKIITGIFSVIICTGILGAQVGAMASIIDTFFKINVLWGIIVSFGIIIIYSSLGGMRAVVFADIFQFAILIIGIPLTFFIGLHYIGGLHSLIQKTPSGYINFFHSPGDVLLFISLFITFMFGETLVPPYVQRLFMAKTSKQTQRGTLYSGLISIPFFIIAGAIGLIALIMNPHIIPNQAMPYVIKETLPIGVRGFVIAGLLAIIMSSAAGFLNAASVAFVNDIIKPLKKDASERLLLVSAKGINFFVGVGAVFFALAINNILDILLYAYNFWSPIILVPLLAVIFNIDAKPKNFFYGASGGIITMLIWSQLLGSPFHISPVVIGILGNLALFIWSRKY